ncbi:hypothetical protein MKZ38_002221 [Zalerion maritima]|uniref:Uncharacterized protein n=1 Tax=Zalerion maritima TaxID=339359 RepID=A0AAD5WSK6_9PEZI|nr:hypothetical protein MKZ38_002221 [Zalerion maritima]
MHTEPTTSTAHPYMSENHAPNIQKAIDMVSNRLRKLDRQIDTDRQLTVENAMPTRASLNTPGQVVPAAKLVTSNSLASVNDNGSTRGQKRKSNNEGDSEQRAKMRVRIANSEAEIGIGTTSQSAPETISPTTSSRREMDHRADIDRNKTSQQSLKGDMMQSRVAVARAKPSDQIGMAQGSIGHRHSLVPLGSSDIEISPAILGHGVIGGNRGNYTNTGRHIDTAEERLSGSSDSSSDDDDDNDLEDENTQTEFQSGDFCKNVMSRILNTSLQRIRSFKAVQQQTRAAFETKDYLRYVGYKALQENYKLWLRRMNMVPFPGRYYERVPFSEDEAEKKIVDYWIYGPSRT